jgi:thiamine-phosphate diphosphorylase
MDFPTHYLITPNPEDEAEFLAALERSLQHGISLLQFKAKSLDAVAYAALAQQVVKLCHDYHCKVLLTGDPLLVQKIGADGLHLDSKALNDADSRPLNDEYLLAVSGHDLMALKHGEAIGANFAVLSPVKYTKAHPDIEPLGWEIFGAIASQLSMPVYALGGVSAEDESAAIAAGGQGIAGNKGYWKA